MRVSLEWLSQYVDTTGLAPEEIGEALTRSGLEVEAIETVGPRFSGVVIGKILALNPHPNADKLRLVDVDLGNEQVRVVCGAPNVAEGLLIPFATDGAQVINRKDGTLFTLGKATIRGVESTGMICSIDELGLDEIYEKPEDGIWPINRVVEGKELGLDLKTALSLKADTILVVAPTANRGDLMSMTGIAREVAALFDRQLTLPEPPALPENSEALTLNVSLGDTGVCQYYGGAVMRNLKIGPSPDWMANRLLAAGMRPISNVVDITNYVMLELGQPLHAFDRDRLPDKAIVDVRRAGDGEPFTTLDDVARKLTTDSVVVTVNDTPVAMAGVMGGADAEIADDSKNLFLETAYFPPATTRKSAKTVGLRSEASARFERGVDLGTCRKALLRAVELLTAHAGAEYVGLSESPRPHLQPETITLRLPRMQDVLGLEIPGDLVVSALEKLGFDVTPSANNTELTVTVPSYRRDDVTREIDLIEEVIRIYGYDKIPYTLPQKTGSAVTSPRRRMIRTLHQVLRGQGLQEVMTTSLIGEQLLEKTGFSVNRDQLVSVVNSHSVEHTIMRQSLLPNLLEVAKFNQAQGTESSWVYELGRTYFQRGKATEKHSGVAEQLQVAGLITGEHLQGEWHATDTPDFYRAKGVVESLLNTLGLVGQITFRAADSNAVTYLHPGKAADVLLSGKPFGVIGELHPQQAKRLKFRAPVYVFELNLETLYKAYKQLKPATSPVTVSQYPAVKRDMAFVAPDTLSHAELLAALGKLNPPHLQGVELFDEYRAEQLGEGKRSLAYRLVFQSPDATLTEADVDTAFNTLKARLAEALPVQFR